MRSLNTIFFDLDGVVINSEPVHAKAKRIVLEKFNISYPDEIFDEYKGRTDDVFFDYVSERLTLGKYSSDFLHISKKIIFEEIVKELTLVDGFPLFLRKVKDNGIRTALVSSTSLYSLGLVDKIYNISGMFDLIITEVDTERHKPEPDPYLKALEKLPAETHNSIAIEDSPNGIISAKRAGCYVYALTSSFNKDILFAAGADFVVESYGDLAAALEL